MADFNSLPIVVPQLSDETLLVRSDAPFALPLYNLYGLMNQYPQPSVVNNNLSTTLTAANIVSKTVVRTGSASSSISDTTDTAGNIIALINGAQSGSGFVLTIVNLTGQNYSLIAGTGVTIQGINSVPPGLSISYVLTVTGSNTVSLYGYSIGFYNNVPLVNLLNSRFQIPPLVAETPQNIATSGGTTLTASNIINQYILRSGPTANFTDVTDTASNILSYIPSPTSGYSFPLWISNLTGYYMTVNGGTNVSIITQSPQSNVIQPYNSTLWLVTITGSSTINMTRILSAGI